LWYNETYLSTGFLTRGYSLPHDLKNDQSSAGINRPYEDAVEKFERMQRISMGNDPESITYNTARLRNDRKVCIFIIFKK
jgi:hypothetical protein